MNETKATCPGLRIKAGEERPRLVPSAEIGRLEAGRVGGVPAGQIVLPVDPVSVSSARQYASKVLARLGWERMTDVAQLVISELVTNGLRAALLLDGRAEGDDQPEKPIAEQYADCDRYLCVGLYLAPHGVVVEVWDPSPEPPKLREPGPDDISGRGLHLVNEIAACWGCRWIKPEGKVVWARLPDESVFPPPDGPGSARRER